MEFDKLKVSDSAKYWFEVAAYVQPYAAIGSVILGGLSFLEETEQSKKLDRILETLEEIKSQIQECRNALMEKIEDTVLRQRTGEVLGTKEILEEYGRLRRDAVLVNLVTASAVYKNGIFISIADETIPLEHRGAYCGLYCTLLPFRATAFELLTGGDRRDTTLIREEIEDLLAIEKVTLEIIGAIGGNRVSQELETETVDVYKTPMEIKHERNYFVEVDGVKTIVETAIEGSSRGGLQPAKASLAELTNEMANEAKKPFEVIFEEAKKSLQALT